MTKPMDLLPELRAWNDGRGISPLDFLFCYARSDLSTAYIDLFWPAFVTFQGYVFRSNFNEDGVRAWQAKVGITWRNVEAAINYLDVGSLFQNSAEEQSDLLRARILLVRATLVETYKAKLDRDFPERIFQVELIDTDDEVAMTFYQS